MSGVRFFRRSIDGADEARADADAELNAVFEARVARSMERGLSLEAARADALNRLGGEVADVRRTLHRSAARRERLIWWRVAVRDLGQDLRYVARSLRRQPAFTAATVLCLVIGIGANAAMFSIVDALLLRPPVGVRDAASVLWINAQRPDPTAGMAGLSYPDYLDLATTPALAQSAAYARRDAVIGEPGAQQRISVVAVTATFMPVLGVTPAIGRFFATDDERFDSAPTAVLGHRLWRSMFAENYDVLGRRIRIGTNNFTIIGVAPSGFNGVERSDVDVYLPVRNGLLDSGRVLSRNTSWLTMLARARKGVARGALAERLDLTYHRAEGVPGGRAKNRIVVAPPMSMVAMHDAVTVQNTSVALWLMAVALIVLAIATANVAGLLVTRTARRQREIAIRLALGVGRWRLMRLVAAEAAVITLLGAAGGVVLAYAGSGLLEAGLIAQGTLSTSVFDSRVLLVTLAIASMTAMTCGTVPAVYATRRDINASMKSSAHAADRRTERALAGLLIGQIALTIVLLVGAGLFVRSLHNLNVLDLGIDVEHSLRARLPLPSGMTPVEADVAAHRVRDVVASIPGVERAVLATAGPFGNIVMKPSFLADQGASENQRARTMSAVMPEFFHTLGIRLLSGRDFASTDRVGTAPVVIVNESMAAHSWPEKSAVGQCVKVGRADAPCSLVVGVVSNSRQGNITRMSIQYERVRDSFYVPLEQQPPGERFGMLGQTLYVRATGDAVALIPQLRRAVESAIPGVSMAEIAAFSTVVEPQIEPWRTGVLMFGFFGALAFLLALIGIYSMLAFRVSQRRKEMGVRLALGATATAIYGTIVGEGARVTAIGVAIGMLASLTVGHGLGAVLFGVSPRDPVVLSAVAGLILAAGVTASFLPARAAVAIDVVRTLRDL